jgi:hypothetical protein
LPIHSCIISFSTISMSLEQKPNIWYIMLINHFCRVGTFHALGKHCFLINGVIRTWFLTLTENLRRESLDKTF